jgi:hypothetical protein
MFLGVVSTVVQDSINKIFIGGLPNYLNEDQVFIDILPSRQRHIIIKYYILFIHTQKTHILFWFISSRSPLQAQKYFSFSQYFSNVHNF